MNWWMLRRKLHSSWLIAAVSAGVVMGVIGVQYLPQGWFASSLWLIIAGFMMALCFWARWVVCLVVMMLAGSLLGLWRGAVLDSQLRPYAQFENRIVEMTGVVKEDVDRDVHGALLVRLEGISVGSASLPGAVRITLDQEADIKRGDHIGIKGKMTEGFGGFAAAVYRGKLIKIKRPEPGDVARQVRDGFAERVRGVVNEPAASLGLGFLLGQRRGLPEELDIALRTAGLTHIVVASGYNLTILVRLARRLFVRLSKYLAALAASVMIVSFIAITGVSPSMSRAGLVTGLALLAWYYGRRFHPVVLLLFAAAVTLMINPTYGWGDLGWQLSFAAFAGVMIMSPLMQRYFFGDTKPGAIRQILGETVAASIVTLPILLMAFGQFSAVAILANVLVLPLVPLAMLLTFMAGLLVLLIPVGGMLVGQGAAWLLDYMIGVAKFLSAAPWAQIELQISPLFAAVMYVVITIACAYAWHVTRYSLRDVNVVE